MTRALALVAALAACGGSQREPSTPRNSVPASASPKELPDEVRRLLERWENCWHFAGEEGTDPARKKEIEDGTAKWCPGNGDERTRLRLKYQNRADVLDALNKLDEMQ